MENGTEAKRFVQHVQIEGSFIIYNDSFNYLHIGNYKSTLLRRKYLKSIASARELQKGILIVSG